ncbi:MAG: hypothetical protein U5R49_14670 [Deltaproteobacteria bacterium]|nr:hypothetical protein [Deltaproteobacteria bacterium]
MIRIKISLLLSVMSSRSSLRGRPLADSIEQFREKKAEALKKGWNHSGAVKAGPAFQAITREMEKKVMKRLEEG